MHCPPQSELRRQQAMKQKPPRQLWLSALQSSWHQHYHFQLLTASLCLGKAETVELIQGLMGTYIEMEVDKERIRPINSEVERLWSENSKALNTFDWIPEYAGVSGLREGLIRTIEWFKLESNMKKYKTGMYNL
jgi:hypothetical protein